MTPWKVGIIGLHYYFLKKFFYLLAALPLLGLAACNDDDDLPSVDISINYENGVQVGNTVYAVMGDTLKVTGITATPKRPNRKVEIGIVNYNFDGVPYYTSLVQPYPCYIPTEDFAEGNHYLGVLMPIYEVDCTPATGFVQVNLKFVSDASEIPTEGATTSTLSLEPSLQ